MSMSRQGWRWYDVAAEAVAAGALLPLAAAIACSFAPPGAPSAYADWWGTARGWEAMGRSMGLAALAATLAVALAWMLAAAAGRASTRYAFALAGLACLPLLVPSSLLATAWIAALGREGAVTQALRPIFGDATFSLFSPTGAAAALALRYFGLAALVLVYARRREEAHWPAEQVFRIPPLTRAVHLRLRPAIKPTVAAWLLVALFCLNDHIIPGMLLVSTYGTQVLIQYSALFDARGAAALAVPMAAVAALAAALALRLGATAWPSADRLLTTRRPPAPLLGRALGAGLAAAILALALAVPVTVLAYRAGSWSALGQAFAGARDQAWETLQVASAAGILCAAAGGLLAACWLRARRQGRWTAVPLVLLNLAVPPSLLAIGLLQLMQLSPWDALRNTSAGLVLGYGARFLPVATVVLFALWREEPPEPLAAARVHGLSGYRTVRHVLWPRHWPALGAVGLLAALLAATELEVSILLAPAGATTLGVRLYTLIHTAPESLTSSLALDMLLGVGPAVLVLALLVSLGRRRLAAEAP